MKKAQLAIGSGALALGALLAVGGLQIKSDAG